MSLSCSSPLLGSLIFTFIWVASGSLVSSPLMPFNVSCSWCSQIPRWSLGLGRSFFYLRYHIPADHKFLFRLMPLPCDAFQTCRTSQLLLANKPWFPPFLATSRTRFSVPISWPSPCISSISTHYDLLPLCIHHKTETFRSPYQSFYPLSALFEWMHIWAHWHLL